MNEQNETVSDQPNTLVVLLHAYTNGIDTLKSIETTVLEELPHATCFRPILSTSRFSMTDPNLIVVGLLSEIDKKIEKEEERGLSFKNIIFIGHSVGALFARKLYIVACGETSKAPLESIYKNDNASPLMPKPWADKVTRIILIAGMNRGWQVSHHISIPRAIVWTIGTGVHHILRLFTKKSLLIFTVRRGAEFITQLRIQWLRMRQRVADSQVSVENSFSGSALTIQLLGSVDDRVAPEDNVDLISGGDFVYIDVPYSGHIDVINLDDKKHGSGRKKKFLLALKGRRDELYCESVIPSDENFIEPDNNITKMVFVIHGIRDAGYWTHKIARRIKLRAKDPSQWATETSSYGYFPMLPFLFPWYRRQKVEWLMDKYAEALARYPKASISYVGHSNGTYLLTKALEVYQCCHFENVVFAGSVVSQSYNWKKFMILRKPRINAILNFVATRDWVVAFFPKLFQFFGSRDLGSLGHDGFGIKILEKNMYQAKYVKGGHSSAIEESMWNMIADFVIEGKVDTEKFPCKSTANSFVENLIKALGHFPLIVWLFIISLVWWGWGGVKNFLGLIIVDSLSLAYATGFASAVYLLLLWLLLTRI